MTRCMTCNNLLTRDENVCTACGTSVREEAAAPGVGEVLAKAIDTLFYLSLALTLASIFLPNTPPVSRCAIISAVLMFIKRSAGQMVEKPKKH